MILWNHCGGYPCFRFISLLSEVILTLVRPLPSEPLSPQRILVIRLSALGDVVQAMPALEALGRLFPDAEIDAVTESLSFPLLRRHPRLKNVICFPRTEIRRHWRTAETRGQAREQLADLRSILHQNYYDLIVDWQSNLRSAFIRMQTRHRHVLQLHPADGGELPKWWYGWRPRKAAGRVHRIERAMHLVRELGYSGETPQGEISIADSSLTLTDKELAAVPLLLHPFVSAFGRFKEWPLTYWKELAAELTEAGHVVWLSGGPGERESLAQLALEVGSSVAVAPETQNTADLAALVQQSRAVVAADTGIIHLASLLGIPAMGLYGPKDPAIHGPTGTNSMVLRSGVPCSPCLLRRCDHSVCMSSLTVAMVRSGIDQLLKTNTLQR
ncbi:MAG: hypothetical protein CBC13_05120 [Planctomycetia bacterium TMED53]|nr:MAG: hypothetical protein CBC13_05120 [Planctomycetia bacterium TMED53]